MFHPRSCRFAAALSFAFLASLCAAYAAEPAQPSNAFLRRVSSGGLMLLDRNGSLVTAPSPANAKSSGSASQAATSATLDPRIGPNIRLGDDPSQLPQGQRSQAEPHIMRSATDFDFLVATFQEGRFSDGGALDCGYSVTHDGGLTWTRTLIPALTTTAGGPYYRATDPVVGIDLAGNTYIATDAATDPSFNNGVIVVSRSTNGGATFEAPVLVFNPNSTVPFPDKEWLAVNRFSNTSTAGRVVVTWTEFANQTSTSPSPLMLSYSDDKGQSWSVAKFITPTTSYLQGSQPVFLANGKLAVVYWNFTGTSEPNNSERIEVIVSNDGGNTFAAPVTVARVAEYSEPAIRDGSFLPSAATDRTTSNLYLVWQAQFNNSPRIMFSKSTDSGSTWSNPIPISDNPAGSGVFNAAISASADGQRLTATFYDHRDNPGSQTLVDLYLAQSFDGGATWQPNIRLTSQSTDASLAVNTGTAQQPAYMLGDYLGIADPTIPNVPAIPVWVDTRTGNPDPFVTRAGIAPQFDFTSWQAARLSYAQIQTPQGAVHPLNISTRLNAQTGDNVPIGGFIISGNNGTKVVVRALGPSLASSGLTGVLADPTLELHDSSGKIIASNNDWRDTQAADIQATGLAPTDDRESAILQTLPAGTYTAVVRGRNDTTGIALVEAYDVGQAAGVQLGNISTRGFVGSGNNVMIGGTILGGSTNSNGTGSARVVVRGIGPSLASANVPNPLQDPLLELHDSNGTTIIGNDNWRDSQQNEIQAAGLAPSDDREAAVVVTIPPGTYTAVVKGKADTTGNALVELYNLQ